MLLSHENCDMLTKLIPDGLWEEKGLIFRGAHGLEEVASSPTEAVKVDRELVYAGCLVVLAV